jgi:hypothetical protein
MLENNSEPNRVDFSGIVVVNDSDNKLVDSVKNFDGFVVNFP